jgi:hypothetical protein
VSQLAINLIAELVPGYMLEGSILGNMVSAGLLVLIVFLHVSLVFKCSPMHLDSGRQILCFSNTSGSMSIHPGYEVGTLHEDPPENYICR